MGSRMLSEMYPITAGTWMTVSVTDGGQLSLLAVKPLGASAGFPLLAMRSSM